MAVSGNQGLPSTCTMEYHIQAMERLCRICGQRNVKFPKSLKNHKGANKMRHADKIIMQYNVNVHLDVKDVHPSYICLSCCAAFGKQTRRPVIKWTPHTNTNCQACDLMRESVAKKRRKPESVGYERRREREEEERQQKAVDDACDILLSSSILSQNPPKKLQKIGTAVVKCMMDEDEVVELPTGGSKLVLQKVRVPRVPSQSASKTTLRERSAAARKTIQLISSPERDEEAATHQLAAMLRGKSSEELKKIMEDAGLLKIRIPAGHELAMKVKYGWSWEFMRSLKRWLAAYKIHMQCEGKTRQAKKDIIADTTIQKEMLPFFHKNKETEELETRLTPMVSIPHLEDHIINTLEDLERNNMLNWDGIPEDQIWVKIGGDSGGGTVKFYYQILNTINPNSKTNSTVFCCYAADESLPNLHIGLDRFVDQIDGLLTATWKDKKIVPWLCADYLMLGKLLGLQGASATFPCIFCLAKRGSLATKGTSRSLEDILKDYENVKQCGCTAKAKRENHSVGHKPFFKIPLEQVCIPELHVNLGLWEKFFNLLVEDINSLGDLVAEKLAEKSGVQQQLPEDGFQRHVQEVKKMYEVVRKKEEAAEELREKATNLQYTTLYNNLVDSVNNSMNNEDTNEISRLHREAEKLEKEVQQLKKEHKIEESKNPLIKQLDESLKDIKVRRQQYHGGTFIGNHVNKCLKPENYTKLLDDMCVKAAELCAEDEVVDYAEVIKIKFLRLLDSFAACYTIYSKATILSSDDISKLEMSITNMCKYFTSKFGEGKCTPKFHLLYHHTIDFLRITGVGLGKMGDQGGELLHHDFNVMLKKKEGIRNVKGEDPDLKQLFSVMEDHLVKVNPATRSLITCSAPPVEE